MERINRGQMCGKRKPKVKGEVKYRAQEGREKREIKQEIVLY